MVERGDFPMLKIIDGLERISVRYLRADSAKGTTLTGAIAFSARPARSTVTKRLHTF